MGGARKGERRRQPPAAGGGPAAGGRDAGRYGGAGEAERAYRPGARLVPRESAGGARVVRPGVIRPDKPVSRYQRRTLAVLAEGGWLERKTKMRRLRSPGYDRNPDRMSFDLYTEQGTRIKRVDPPTVG